MPSGELVNQELRAMGDLVPDVPDHHAEMGQIPMTRPQPPEAGGK
jgi:hypothetical protein